MRSIPELQQLIGLAVAEQRFPAQPKELYEPISYLMQLGGKRMRPVLLLMATDLFEGDPEQALPAALAIEVFHNFTLMHDDIMDNAPLRRGKATVHEKWSSSVAILSGDVMLVEAYKLLMKVPASVLEKVLKVFNETAVGVCEGQQIDMNFEKRSHVSIDEYLEMIRLKTAVLLGGSLSIGALVAGAPNPQAQLAYAFGENLGIAFQLQDDILDVYGDPEKFGKQVGGDIISNKKTYLLIKALETAKGDDLHSLENWLLSNEVDLKVSAVTALYDKLGVRTMAEQQMISYADKALNALQQIDAPQDRKQELEAFAQTLLVREC